MRIGQILIEADLISPKQLSNGLEYGKIKHIALGRVLKLLKVMDESDIERALEAQKLIRLGLSPVIALDGLKKSVKQRVSLQAAIQERHKNELERLEQDKDKDKSKRNDEFLEVDYAAAPEKLIEKGDKFLLEDQCALAESHYMAARTVMERTLGRNHIDIASVLNRLGNAYMATERFDKAEECYEEVLILKMKAFPSTDPQISEAYVNLADLYQACSDEDQARENYQMALNILERGLPSTLSQYSSILRRIAASAQLQIKGDPRPQPIGELLKSAGLLTDEQLQTALRLSKQTGTPIGTVFREQRMVTELDIQSSLKAQFYIRYGVITDTLAFDLLSRASRRRMSLERLLHEAGVQSQDPSKFDTYREIAVELDHLVATETSSGANHQELAPIAYKVAALYEDAGDKPQAEVYYNRALKIWGSETRGDLNAARACTALAKIYVSQNKKSEAIPLFLKALEHRQHSLGASHDDTIETLEDIAEAEIAQHNPWGAISFLRSALSAREEQGHDESKLLRVVLLHGDCSKFQDNLPEAEAYYTRAIELAQAGFGSTSLALVSVVEKLGDLYAEQNQMQKAHSQYNYGLIILKRAGKLETETGTRFQSKVSKAKATLAG